MSVSLREGAEIDRDALLRRLVDMQYTRNDFEPARGTFRVRGDMVDVIPAAAQEKGVRVELFGDEIERIAEVEIATGKALRYMNHVMIFPASHYATSKRKDGSVSGFDRTGSGSAGRHVPAKTAGCSKRSG